MRAASTSPTDSKTPRAPHCHLHSGPWLDIQAVRRALIYVRIQDGPLPAADLTAVAVALHSPVVRQICLTTVDSEWAITAARLWFKAVRRVPAPYTADAAALLAANAFSRGSLEFAQRTVDLVLPSARHHPLAAVIADALDNGTPTLTTEQVLDSDSEPFLYFRSQLNQPAPQTPDLVTKTRGTTRA